MPPVFLDSVVDQLVSKLQLDASWTKNGEVLDKAEEQLRILAARVRLGQLGAKIDRPLTRAAVVLEETVRRETGHRLPVIQLAAAAGIKVAHLEELRQVVGNYLSSASSSASHGTTRRQPKKGSGASTSRRLEQHSIHNKRGVGQMATAGDVEDQDHHDRPSRSEITHLLSGHQQQVQDRLTALTIRLAAILTDPAQVAQQAARLWQDLRDHVQSLPSSVERDGQGYDMERYTGAYLAACLYVVVNQESGPLGTGTDPHRRPNHKKGKGKRPAHGESLLARGRGGALTLEQLVDAAVDCTHQELKQILPYVIQTAHLLRQDPHQATNTSNTSNKKYKTTPTFSSQSSGTGQTAAATGGPLGCMQGIESDRGTAEMDGGDPDDEQAEDRAWQQWTAWREQILAKAVGEVQEQASSAPEQDPLTSAANRVLQKYGLLVST